MARKFASSPAADGLLSEINMTPLIDVMLVLLIVFMLTLPVLSQEVKLNLPRDAGVAPVNAAQKVVLSINAHGQIYWDSQPISAATLKQRMARLKQQPVAPTIEIRADQKTEYQHIMTVMALAQQQGLAELNFVTQAAAH